MSRHRKAFDALIAKHWEGDVEAFTEWFTHIGMMASDPVPQNGAWQRWEPRSRLPPYAQEALRRYRCRRQGED